MLNRLWADSVAWTTRDRSRAADGGRQACTGSLPVAALVPVSTRSTPTERQFERTLTPDVWTRPPALSSLTAAQGANPASRLTRRI